MNFNKIFFPTHIIILISFLHSFSSFSLAQNDFKDFFKVGADLYSASFHFDKNDWLRVGAVGAATAGAMFLDETVKSFSQRNQNDIASFVFEIDKYFYIEGAAISIASIYGYGAVADDEKIKNLGLQLAEASFYASTINILMKMAIGRKRPNADCGCISYDPFTLDIMGSSLPSAHSTLSFAYSTVMANYSDNSAWKILWYTLSSLTALARIYHNMHWFSDTVFGAALGYFVGEFVVNHPTNNIVPTPAGLAPSYKLFSLKFSL